MIWIGDRQFLPLCEAQFLPVDYAKHKQCEWISSEQDRTAIELSERDGPYVYGITKYILATAHGLQVRLPSLPGL